MITGQHLATIGSVAIFVALIWQATLSRMLLELRQNSDQQDIHGKLDLLWRYVGGTISSKLDGRTAAMTSDSYFELMKQWDGFSMKENRIHRQQRWIDAIHRLLLLSGSALVLIGTTFMSVGTQ
ncbi:MAG: hypothetical protein AAF665_11160 [Pseudomonadota bacterium]